MRSTWIAISLIWVLCVIAGLGQLWHYGHQPGVSSEPPTDSVRESHTANSDRFRLEMFAHPKCPCTRASLYELERIISQAGEKLEVAIHFYKPTYQPQSWVETDLWQSAQQIPGARLEVDEDNSTAQRLQVATSGSVLVYDPGGKLLFNGGITSARGHVGDNFGAKAILALVRGETSGATVFPVFGCPLQFSALLPSSTGSEACDVN
jgi:hypothetical protein